MANHPNYVKVHDMFAPIVYWIVGFNMIRINGKAQNGSSGIVSKSLTLKMNIDEDYIL